LPAGGPSRAGGTALAAILIVLAGVAAYCNSFGGPFIFDDLKSIPDNPTIRSLSSPDVLRPPAATTVARRPVLNLSLAVNYAIGAFDVRGYHAANLLFHLLAALLLFGVIRRTLTTPLLRERYGAGALPMAVAVAALWTLHPLQTESVTYVIQRAESLMALFFLLTLYCAIRGATGPSPRRWQAAAVLACAVGIGAKEVTAVAPIVVLLYDRTFLAGSFREALRQRWGFYLALAATWGVFALLMALYPGGQAAAAGFGLRSVTPWEYARTQPGVILHYLRLSVWPHPLCLDYGWPVARTAREIGPPAIALAALLAGTLWALRRAPAVGFLGASFFLILAPTSSIMPIADLAFEHRMYLPLAALLAGVVLGAREVLRWAGPRLAQSEAARATLLRVMAGALLLAAAGALGYGTFLRNRDYRSDLAIWEDTAAKSPNNARVFLCRGCAYLAANRLTEALRDFDRAIALNPGYIEAYTSRSALYTTLDRYAEAIGDCDKAIALNPKYAEAHNNRGAALGASGRQEEALRAYGTAIALSPANAKAYCNRGAAYYHTQRLPEALRDFDKAIGLKPDYVDAYCNRGAVHFSEGRLAEAVADFSRTISLDRGYLSAYNNRARTHIAMGRPEEAVRDYGVVIALRPDQARAYCGRGEAMAKLNRFPEAVADFSKAIALSPGYSAAYSGRATGYCELREYDKALADVKAMQRMGARVDPGLLKRASEGKVPAPQSPASRDAAQPPPARQPGTP
jgi:tetratricopeptide (TPR) repeat protein